MRKKKVIRVILLALIVVWMLSIFKLSNQNGDESSGLSRKVVSIFTSEKEIIEKTEPYVRKMAHLSEYAIGGVLFLSVFLTYAFSDKKRMLFSLLIGIEYAALDEIHQLFVDGRSGQLVDVLIDTIGVFIGSCLAMLVYKIVQKLRKRKDGVSDKKESH